MEESKPVVSINKKKNSWFLNVLSMLLIVVLACLAYYYHSQYQKIKENPQIVSQKETAVIVSAISKLMELPGDETPSIATVQDKEKLQEQEFFRKSENEDKILIYANAKKAILYRPSTNKIIEVAPLFLNDNSTEQPAQNIETEEVEAEQEEEPVINKEEDNTEE